MAGLRKLTGTPPERGMYEISGSLDGVVPGRRIVGDLHVRRLDGSVGEGLAPLAAFGDLRVLRLEDVRDLDLGPLRDLQLEQLRFNGVAHLDLGELQLPDGLQVLDLTNVDDDCGVPRRLDLPSTLQGLFIGERRSGRTGRQAQALLEAVDWSQLPALKALNVHLDELEPIPEIDLGFLRKLPELEILWMTGVRHSGSVPSPLEPPFDGLSRKLRYVTLQAKDRIPTREALERYLAIPDHEEQRLIVRDLPLPPPPSWQVRAPVREGGEWHAYGSLADHAGLASDKTEYDALRAVRKVLKEADPQLLRRLDFDPEAGGTGIMARTREDLMSALAILGIAP